MDRPTAGIPRGSHCCLSCCGSGSVHIGSSSPPTANSSAGVLQPAQESQPGEAPAPSQDHHRIANTNAGKSKRVLKLRPQISRDSTLQEGRSTIAMFSHLSVCPDCIHTDRGSVTQPLLSCELLFRDCSHFPPPANLNCTVLQSFSCLQCGCTLGFSCSRSGNVACSHIHAAGYRTPIYTLRRNTPVAFLKLLA